MNVLIVYAHPEAGSFNGAMVQTATRAFTRAGHAVRVSDLYRMRFDPVSDRRNFTTVHDPRYFQQQDEERHASEAHGFAPRSSEIDKLFWCDLLVFQVSDVVVRSSGDAQGLVRPRARRRPRSTAAGAATSGDDGRQARTVRADHRRRRRHVRA